MLLRYLESNGYLAIRLYQFVIVIRFRCQFHYDIQNLLHLCHNLWQLPASCRKDFQPCLILRAELVELVNIANAADQVAESDKLN